MLYVAFFNFLEKNFGGNMFGYRNVISYGNTKGKNIILDADENWILVEITTPKTTVQKLFRIDSIDGLTLVKE